MFMVHSSWFTVHGSRFVAKKRNPAGSRQGVITKLKNLLLETSAIINDVRLGLKTFEQLVSHTRTVLATDL